MITIDRLKGLGPKRIWIEPGLKVELDRKATSTQDLWDAEIAVTRAEYGIAETGSIVVSNAGQRPRLASLAPEVHVVVLSRTAVVSSLDEAIEEVDRTFVIITGPSRTADIEGVIVRGAHGPRELWLIWGD